MRSAQLNTWRSQVSWGRCVEETELTAHPGPAGEVTQAVEDRAYVLADLEKANRKLRKAVAAARSEGATLAQLAEIMGVSPQAVHRHWIERRSDPS